jgi:hypothetical protein
MLNILAAERALLNTVPLIRLQDAVRYKDVYLFRVEFASEEEKDYDPFFSVDVNTGEVRDFSVLTDGDLSEITDLFLHHKEGIM